MTKRKHRAEVSSRPIDKVRHFTTQSEFQNIENVFLNAWTRIKDNTT